jgi:PKD repeat protein
VNAPSTNTAPNAAFTVNPTGGDTHTVFQFNASGSSDAEDVPSALEVRWDWENDGTWDTGWRTAKTASHTYSSSGAYTVRLRVRDTGGLTDSATRQVIVGGHLIFLPFVLR